MARPKHSSVNPPRRVSQRDGTGEQCLISLRTSDALILALGLIDVSLSQLYSPPRRSVARSPCRAARISCTLIDPSFLYPIPPTPPSQDSDRVLCNPVQPWAPPRSIRRNGGCPAMSAGGTRQDVNALGKTTQSVHDALCSARNATLAGRRRSGDRGSQTRLLASAQARRRLRNPERSQFARRRNRRPQRISRATQALQACHQSRASSRR